MSENTSETRGLGNLSRALARLETSGQERTRLTEQLQHLVRGTLDAIAASVSVGTNMVVAGMALAVREVTSNIDSQIYMMCETSEENGPRYVVFDSAHDPGTYWYLHGDFGCQVWNASRQQWLAAANHMPEIVSAFQAETDKVITALRSGFETLRKMAGE